MGQRVNLKSELKLLDEGVAEANLKSMWWVFWIRPETKWSIYNQVEDILMNVGRLNFYMLQNIKKSCE